jgi:hypothetical protein
MKKWQRFIRAGRGISEMNGHCHPMDGWDGQR